MRYIYIYIYVCVCVCVCVCVFVCVCVCVYIYIYIYTNTHTHTHMYMYTLSVFNPPRSHQKSLRQDPQFHSNDKAQFPILLYSISYRSARHLDQPASKYIGFILFSSQLIASLQCLISSCFTVSEEQTK